MEERDDPLPDRIPVMQSAAQRAVAAARHLLAAAITLAVIVGVFMLVNGKFSVDRTVCIQEGDRMRSVRKRFDQIRREMHICAARPRRILR